MDKGKRPELDDTELLYQFRDYIVGKGKRPELDGILDDRYYKILQDMFSEMNDIELFFIYSKWSNVSYYDVYNDFLYVFEALEKDDLRKVDCPYPEKDEYYEVARMDILSNGYYNVVFVKMVKGLKKYARLFLAKCIVDLEMEDFYGDLIKSLLFVCEGQNKV